jgi:galactitol PTS system EIIC component
MSVIVNALNWFVGLGPAVLVATVLLILGTAFGAGFKKSLRGGITTGIGLTGLFLIVDLIVGAITPVTISMAERLNIQLSLIDVGWADAGVAWGWPGVAAVMIGIIVVNLIMVFFKLTKTLWTDVWSFWHGQVTAAFVWVATGSLVLGVAAGILYLVIGSLFSDITAKRYQEFNDMPGIGVPCGPTVIISMFAIPMANLLSKIPLIKDINASPEAIRKRFGVFGEMSVMGAIIGAILGLIAGYNLGGILVLAMQIAAVMVLLPRMVSIISEGLIPITMQVSEFVREKFANRELYVGVDCAVLLGHPAVMASALILYPLTLLLAAVLPGNGILPIASLAVIPFLCGAVVPFTKGNVVHTVIIVLVWLVPIMYFATNMSPIHTATYSQLGLLTEQIEGGARIASFDMGGDAVSWVINQVFGLFR